MDDSDVSIIDSLKALFLIYVVIAGIKGMFLSVMPLGANDLLTRVDIEGHKIDIPVGYTDVFQDGNKAAFTYDEPYLSTTVCTFEREHADSERLKDTGEKMAKAVNEDAEFKETGAGAQYRSGSFSWKQDDVDMTTHLYIGNNKYASFYVRVDMPASQKKLSKAMRWSFHTGPKKGIHVKETDFFMWYDFIDCEYKRFDKENRDEWCARTILFDNLVYFQGYQFEVPGNRRVWTKDCYVYELSYDSSVPFATEHLPVLEGYDGFYNNLQYVFDEAITFNFKYLEFKDISADEISGVSDKYLSEQSQLSVVDSYWTADNIYRVNCLNSEDGSYVFLLFIADGECCFLEKMTIPAEDYPYLQSNIENAVNNIRLLEWTEDKKVLNRRAVYFYNHEDDNMYWDLEGDLRRASSEKMNRLGEPPKPTIKLYLPDSDEAYNWRLYTDADAFAWENRDKLDYGEAVQLFEDMHEKYADDYNW